MFSPVGSLPPSVYWRRRIMVVGVAVLLLVLVVLTVRAASGSDTRPRWPAAAAPTPTSASTPRRRRPAVDVHVDAAGVVVHRARHQRAGRRRPPSSTAGRCAAVHPGRAVGRRPSSGNPAYQVGDQPLVELQVTNTGAHAVRAGPRRQPGRAARLQRRVAGVGQSRLRDPARHRRPHPGRRPAGAGERSPGRAVVAAGVRRHPAAGRRRHATRSTRCSSGTTGQGRPVLDRADALS